MKWSLRYVRKRHPEETKEETNDRLREPIITIETVDAEDREDAENKLRKIGYNPEEYDYLLEYKPPDSPKKQSPARQFSLFRFY